jgi:hypothetical protein
MRKSTSLTVMLTFRYTVLTNRQRTSKIKRMRLDARPVA